MLDDSDFIQPNSGVTGQARARLPAVLLIIVGLLLIIGDVILIWALRGVLADTSPHDLLLLWYGMGGLVLLYLTAGLPLGAILLAAGGALLYPTAGAGRVLLPLLAALLIFATYDVVRLLLDWSIPFLLFAISGFLLIALFMMLVWVWARKRPTLGPQRQRVADFQLGAGVCFFSAAWQACGLAGAPSFALYPEIVLRLGNQSFVAGQAFVVKFFVVLAFVFLLLAMRAERPQNARATPQRSTRHDSDSDRPA